MFVVEPVIAPTLEEGAVEQEIVVTSYDDLVLVRLPSYPAVKLIDLGDGAARGEVASVKENIAVGHIELIVPARCVDDISAHTIATRVYY